LEIDMPLELYMVGVVAGDSRKSQDFYRRLGVAVPEDSGGQPHVEVKMQGGLTFFINAAGRAGISDSPQVVFEFYLKERSAVDAKHAELTGFGYESFRPPFVTSFGMYFALVKDPDGNLVLLSAD
jgi:catechol 2,3-dioxygenase-like lactoylglutathione lyase family enzyme